MNEAAQTRPPRLSIAVRAWNEETIIRRTLESLFKQSLFEQLSRRGERCEVICIPNGCTDRTPRIAAEVMAEQKAGSPFAHTFDARVVEIEEAGRNHTWNAFVHELSSREAEFLYLMDSDILFNRHETLFNMYQALLDHPEARVASDQPIKDLLLKPRKTWRDAISLATSAMSGTIEGKISGQLYCIRSEVARRLYLPRQLGIDDGFIKAVVCTDFFTRDLNPQRVIQVRDASHVFEAYTSVGELLKNQKRQMIGQTIVHVLVKYLEALVPQRNLASLLQKKEQHDPDWLMRLVQQHLSRVHFFWQLFPGAASFRFRRWWKMRGLERVKCFPATMVGFALTMIACAQAQQHFKTGRMHFWPRAGRNNFQNVAAGDSNISPRIPMS